MLWWKKIKLGSYIKVKWVLCWACSEEEKERGTKASGLYYKTCPRRLRQGTLMGKVSSLNDLLLAIAWIELFFIFSLLPAFLPLIFLPLIFIFRLASYDWS